MRSIGYISYYVRKRIELFALPRLLKQNPRDDVRRLGSIYGGYYVPMDLLSSSSICYSGGIGEDITFDLEFIEATGCDLFAFDPTPRSVQYVEAHASDQPKFHFIPQGLWHSDETLKFYAPRDRKHVSHSVMNLQETENYFEAPCRRLSSVMRELGHDRIDLLKLNIEGAHYAVMESVVEDKVPVKVIAVSIDQPTSPVRVYRAVKSLQRYGYDLVKIDGWNYTFVLREPA